MSRQSNNETNQPEERRTNTNQMQITQFINRNRAITQRGYIDKNKRSENTRILSLNPNGINPWDDTTMHMMNQSLEKYQIDIALFNETNLKWTPINLDKIENNLKRKYRELKVIGADSKQWNITSNNYLPGGLLTIVKGKCRATLQEDKTFINELGNWMATMFTHNGKTLAIINLYRIPSTSSNGPRCCVTQYNLVKGASLSNSKYRKEILNQIKDFIQNNNFNDIIISGDFNQNIASNEIQQFFSEIGVKDIHSTTNNIEITQMDNTNVNGSHPIDSIAATREISDYIEGCQMVDNNDIIYTDHRGYLVDINLEDYFNDQLSYWNENHKVIINPSRRSHREKFVAIIEDKIDLYNLNEMIEEIKSNPIPSRIEIVDNLITKIFNQARKKIEGIDRRVPYSQEKVKARETINVWKAVIRKLQHKPIDENKLQTQIHTWDIQIDHVVTVEEAKLNLQIAKERWSEVKKNGQEYRQQYLLDHYHSTLDESQTNHQKMKSKVLKSIEKQQKRTHAFRYLSKHAGKGIKGSLKRLHIINHNNEIQKTIIDKESIENEIMKYNTKHFKEAHQSKTFKDKIYAELHNDVIRNNILNGQLTSNQCDYEDVWKFLKLLKVPTGLRTQYPSRSHRITKEEWIKMVLKAKKNSASSIFSKRTYSIYKCSIGSERMTDILIDFYNTIIEIGYYPERWLNIIDVMLEKGKGPKLGKLRTITLIEGDLQLLMRIFLDGSTNELIEKDPRFSKANYGSRKNFSIESAILEKRLILDHSLLSQKETIYNLTDLKACYDRQLSKIGSIVEESTGRNRKAMVLFTKIMPHFKHHVQTGYGISERYYGGKEDELAGTGQGNKFSGDMCRDISCLIIKQLEKEQLGIIFKSNLTHLKEQCVSVSFVDDTDFVSEGQDHESKMMRIVKSYHQLYSATGGQIEISKSKLYAWKWIRRQGRKEIKQIRAKISIENDEIEQLPIHQSIKSLGIWMEPSMSWEKQFASMKEKLREAISKLNNTPMNSRNAYLYYNMYLIKKVYFGCGIIRITRKQENELLKICERPILRKLGLSEKFPRELLYSRKSALGIGLLKPSTIIAILAAKLYIGHMRKNDRIANMIKINEEEAEWEYGYSQSIHQISQEHKTKQSTWSDEIATMWNDRGIKFHNKNSSITKITSNKTIMDYAIQFTKSNQEFENSIQIINHVRIFKQMLLPCELVGLNGNKRTFEFRNSLERSCIRWKIKFPTITKPSKKSVEIWKQFIEWLEKQVINTNYDFEEYADFKYKISVNSRVLKVYENNVETYYIRNENQGRDVIYSKTNEDPEETEFNNIIAEKRPSGKIIIYNEIISSHWPSRSNETNIPFNSQISRAIQNDEIVAASDASCKWKSMTGHWIIASTNENIRIENTIFHRSWGNNTIVGAEAITLLELVEVISRKSKHISHGSIEIAVDNKKVYRAITNELPKPTQYSQDGGAAITRIKELINESTITIKLILTKCPKKNIPSFQNKPLEHLISRCDKTAKSYHHTAYHQSQVSNIKFYGNQAITINNQLSTNSIKEAIRIVDGRQAENEYRIRKLKHLSDWVDGDAREAVPLNKISTSILKCVAGYNHYGLRNALINNNQTEESCPRCNEVETWEHVVKCDNTVRFRKDFITDMTLEILAIDQNQVSVDEIFSMCEDILNFLESGDHEDYETNQHMIGMAELFRGNIVKVWSGVNFNQNKYQVLNKIIIKHCVLYYEKCWRDRNEIFHNEEKQKERVIRWKKKIELEVETNQPSNVKLFVSQMKIDETQCSSKTILIWIYNVKKIMRKVKKYPPNDIRRYFV